MNNLLNITSLRRVQLIAGSLLLVFSLGGGGCVTEYRDANDLESFKVSLTPGHGVETGAEGDRVPYVSGASCENLPCPGGEECLGYCCKSGDLCADDDDCPMDERCAMVCARPVWLDVDAVLRDGSLYEPPADQTDPWRLWVEVDMHPGFVPPPFRALRLENGRARDVRTFIARAVGESHVWVEDTGRAPVDGDYGARTTTATAGWIWPIRTAWTRPTAWNHRRAGPRV